MNISNIKQKLESVDYVWTKPQTYLVFIPGISLVIQKIQLANTLPLINNNLTTLQNVAQADAKSRKFANICKWHLRGSMVQILASVIAIKFFAVPIFLLLAILATYELADTLIKSLKNSITFYELYPNGSIKSKTSPSACTIF